MQKKLLYFINLFLVVCISVLGTLWYVDKKSKNSVESTEQVVKNVTITENNTIKEAIEKVYDAVVVIEVSTRSGSGTGSGFFYKSDKNTGYIITNHHVVEGATSVSIINSAGIKAEAKVLGSDEYSDIAVLSTDAANVGKVVCASIATDSPDIMIFLYIEILPHLSSH